MGLLTVDRPVISASGVPIAAIVERIGERENISLKKGYQVARRRFERGSPIRSPSWHNTDVGGAGLTQ